MTSPSLPPKARSRRHSDSDSRPKPFTGKAFQGTPAFIIQAKRHIHVSGRSAQLPDNIEFPFQGSFPSSAAQRGQP